MRLARRVRRLEEASIAGREALVLVREFVTADNGRPAADQGELIALADRRAGKEWRRQRGEPEEGFKIRAQDEAREAATLNGRMVAVLHEIRRYGATEERAR